MLRKIAAILLFSAACASHGIIELNFNNFDSQNSVIDTTGLRYSDIADSGSTGVNIDAVVIATSPYPRVASSDEARNGSFGDDININLAESRALLGNPAAIALDLELRLYAGGTNYTTPFTSNQTYSFNLTFWDIDGQFDRDQNGTLRGVDGIIMHTPSTYVVAQDNRLNIATVGNSVWFEGDGTGGGSGSGEINGQDSVESATILSAEQAQNSVIFTFTDTNVVSFTYQIRGGEINRNLFIDGGDLIFGDTPTNPPESIVPEPAAYSYTAVILLLFCVLVRRRRQA